MEVGEKLEEVRLRAVELPSRKIVNIDLPVKPSVLLFYKMDFDPVVSRIAEELSKYFDFVTLIGCDSVYSHKVFAEISPRLRKVRGVIVEDEDCILRRSWAEVSGKEYVIMLIDREGIIRFRMDFYRLVPRFEFFGDLAEGLKCLAEGKIYVGGLCERIEEDLIGRG